MGVDERGVFFFLRIDRDFGFSFLCSSLLFYFFFVEFYLIELCFFLCDRSSSCVEMVL